VAILIDSSVWIAADQKRLPEHKRLRAMIEADELIVTCLPIQVEVCQGARTKAEFDYLWNAFLGFDRLEIRPEHWEASAWNYFRCRESGVTPSTVDCLIATLAHAYRVPLWTRDKSFRAMQPIVGCDLYMP
jgi:predicted nucleic acid-binding protein